MYEGVHNQHHAKTYYGTANDPEYLPLALMKPWTLPLFLIAAALAPIGVLIRFGILAPLSLLSPSLARNGGCEIFRAFRSIRSFRRKWPDGDFRRDWIVQETAASIWAIALIAMAVDRHHSAARFRNLPRHRLGRHVPQPGADPGRASVGE